MKELSLMEMNEVSGAYSWNFTDVGSFFQSAIANVGELALSTIVGGAAGLAAGTYIGGSHGGDGGGLLGVGVIGSLVGVIVGPIVGAITVGATCAATGWESTQSIVKDIYDSFLNGTIR